MSSLTPDAVITALIDGQADAWTRGDADAWAASFSEDATFVNILGMSLRGRAEIAARHAMMFRTVFRGSTSRVLLESATPVGTDTVLVRTEHVVSGQRQQPPGIAPTDSTGALRTRMLYVLVRTPAEGTWIIVAAQNTAIAPTIA